MVSGGGVVGSGACAATGFDHSGRGVLYKPEALQLARGIVAGWG